MNTPVKLALGMLTLPLLPLTAQVQPQPPQITVSGSAEIKVAPDEIDLNVEIETRHGKLDVAKRENDGKISRVLEFLKRSGVADKDIQTDFVGIQPLYENDSKSARIYSVEKSLGIKLRRVGSFEAVLSGLLTNGVNTVHGIQFRTSELRKHRDSARQMAIRAAREKADALAQELGVKRGKVHQITEKSVSDQEAAFCSNHCDPDVHQAPNGWSIRGRRCSHFPSGPCSRGLTYRHVS